MIDPELFQIALFATRAQLCSGRFAILTSWLHKHNVRKAQIYRNIQGNLLRIIPNILIHVPGPDHRGLLSVKLRRDVRSYAQCGCNVLAKF